jgi:hypothetical protein
MRLLTILFFACTLSLSAYAQKAPAGYCLMRVFDVNKFAGGGTGYMGPKIIITYESGTQETVNMLSYNEKNELENLKTVVTTLNKLKGQGYMLMSANSTGDQGNIVTDYVLLKQAY